MTWTLFGPQCLLLTFEEGNLARTRLKTVLRYIEHHPPLGLAEVVPGFCTLLLVFDKRCRLQLAKRAPAIVAELQAAKRERMVPPRLHEIPVCYDGVDLDIVMKQTGLSRSSLIRLHARPVYTVAMLGFAPGFPYLSPLDRRLQLPRRTSPRVHVPAGSIAIGGPHTGIYPTESPGGWHLIGRTDVVLFDPALDESGFLLAPGDRVRFIPVEMLPSPQGAGKRKR